LPGIWETKIKSNAKPLKKSSLGSRSLGAAALSAMINFPARLAFSSVSKGILAASGLSGLALGKN
jgi:hypothetical protein